MASLQIVIDPVLLMMLVASLMMEPGFCHAGLFPLSVVRTAIALIEPDARRKLCPAVFAQIMDQSLAVQPYSKTVLSYEPAVFSDCFEMRDRMAPAPFSGSASMIYCHPSIP